MTGLAMFIIGLLFIVFGYFEYGITPVVVGLVLIAYYRKYLWQILGISQV
jgi:TctA family transporter